MGNQRCSASMEFQNGETRVQFYPRLMQYNPTPQVGDLPELTARVFLHTYSKKSSSLYCETANTDMTRSTVNIFPSHSQPDKIIFNLSFNSRRKMPSLITRSTAEKKQPRNFNAAINHVSIKVASFKDNNVQAADSCPDFATPHNLK
ncbi:hypothetical protein NPIL_306811 [Nephila pilipes]|uniref:Uncharacterized protein n=1 Tax=Nephila pilipes TaxID=299642 RepID=A0A8X6N7G6_NEPPI|nr:hypothetical protein NPIL_306811 [Nephila pilipes]